MSPKLTLDSEGTLAINNNNDIKRILRVENIWTNSNNNNNNNEIDFDIFPQTDNDSEITEFIMNVTIGTIIIIIIIILFITVVIVVENFINFYNNENRKQQLVCLSQIFGF